MFFTDQARTKRQVGVRVPDHADTIYWRTPLEHPYACSASETHIQQSTNCSQQTTMSSVEISAIMQENVSLKQQFADKERLGRSLIVEKVFKSDANVMRYTGIPSQAMFNALFDMINESGDTVKYWSGQTTATAKFYERNNSKKPGPQRKLLRKEEFLLTMVRLRTGMLISILADIFGISESRVSQIFATWINLLSPCLKSLIKWPSKKKVRKHMPSSFRKDFPNTRAIIDCTEVFIKKPGNTKAQSITYSTYKSHNTAKL